MNPKDILLIGGAGVVALVILSQKPADDAFGGAGGEAVEKEKKPEEAGEDDTVFITTTERAEAISGKKGVTAPESEWESLFETIGEYTAPSETSLAMGGYERMSGAFKVLGPTHPMSTYQAQIAPTGAQYYEKGGKTYPVTGTWEKAYLAGARQRHRTAKKALHISQGMSPAQAARVLRLRKHEKFY